MIIAERYPSLERSTSTSCITLLIRTCISWRKYCAGKETMCTSSDWDSTDRTIREHIKIMLFDKIFIHILYNKYINISI